MGKDRVIEFLYSLSTLDKKEIPKPTVILFNGKRIRLKSGKSVWINKGSARSAFTNAINYLVNYRGAKEVRLELEKEGILEFREL